eukprot:gnl/TRDRNA2_/TRDRNA2_173246_c0_seq2.p1 gnl/TRDRNA2_/TRDRNA2_173246_c0~~gnl/TRDRNA2_/TRDRNA2_173246_c0_seq2.p1  ORF type:complete len:427 (+),score=91.53 gnl/TRDRNA2_/TRDRNA2_173246_c0_seq2:100-1380(+)
MTGEECVDVYLLPSVAGEIHAVVCDNPKAAPFQDAVLLMQDTLELHGDGADTVVRDPLTGQLDDVNEDKELVSALQKLDKKAGDPWRLFTVAKVTAGPFSGLVAVGIGSNQQKLKRASSLAIAIAAARSQGPLLSCAMQDLLQRVSLHRICPERKLMPAIMDAQAFGDLPDVRSIPTPLFAVTDQVLSSAEAWLGLPPADKAAPPPPPPPPPPPLVSSGETAESLKMSLPVTQEYRLDGGDSSASDGGDNVSQSSYDHKASPLVNPKESPRSDSGRDSARSQPLPPQAYTLQASVAWQDLVNLRSQVRQLELSLNEEKHLHASSKKECEMARSEVREMELQRRLQNTVGQAQQMEYIRNVFRKFVETMPVGAAESEMLIPVLMSFFQISEEEAKEMKEKRKLCVAKSQGLFGSLSSWGASSAARSS